MYINVLFIYLFIWRLVHLNSSDARELGLVSQSAFVRVRVSLFLFCFFPSW